jgi:class 3 adenylate cyclase
MDTDQLARVAPSRRVRRSFGFVDLCGFTDFVDEHGDEAAVEELQRLRATVREITPLFGVRIEKWLGDGVMIVSTASDALVGAVVAICERHGRNGRLLLRAGVATGDVLLLEGDDYVGSEVNLAARLCDAAPPGTVFGSRHALVVPHWVRVEQAPPVLAKGFAEPVAAVELRADLDRVDLMGSQTRSVAIQ